MKRATIVHRDAYETTPISFWVHRPLDADAWPNAKRFDPPLPARAAWLAGALFVATLAGLGLFLWHVHRLSWAEQLAGSAALVAALWAIGALTQARGAAQLGTDSVALGR